MNRFALISLAAAPLAVASAGVIAARLANAPIDVAYKVGEPSSSCVVVNRSDFNNSAVLPYVGMSHYVMTPLDESWWLDVNSQSATCSKTWFTVFAQGACTVRGPALIHYEATYAEEFARIETIGEHEVRANRRGLTCRQLN